MDKSRTDFLDMARITGKENARQYIEAKVGMIEATKTAFSKEKVAEKGKGKEVKQKEKGADQKEASTDLGR